MDIKIKSRFMVLTILILGILVINFSFVSSVGENTYCAERTTGGAWCQNVPLENVDQNYRFAPTNCESTSYCKLGTCVDSQEGTCLENTPQITCEIPQEENQGGVWFDSSSENIPQCTLGCCLLGEQAAFVTQTRCKQLSSLYGLETNYRTDIQNEFACIAEATSSVKGACVFEEEFERTCKISTKGECNDFGTETEFHEGKLCSSESLATNCGPSEKTTLINGKDGVYFVDTCGNQGNIYDANRQGDKSYWDEIIDKGESCNPGDGNAGSSTCGNCDYFLGSTGKQYTRGIDPVAPQFGEYICRDLGCTYEGEDFQHGETWCSVSSDDGENNPGSRYHRLVCYNGDVSVESCSEFRQEVCIQDELNDFSTAACRVNKWQDCTSQTSQKNCENTDKRDCSWTGEVCVPKFAPGFDFWKTESDAESLCALGNDQCVVKFEQGLFDDDESWECVENCECLGEGWVEQKNRMCVALGDCGVIENYLGHEGYNELSDLVSIAGFQEGTTSSTSSGSEGGFFT